VIVIGDVYHITQKIHLTANKENKALLTLFIRDLR
jgi:hypothetical protein